MGLRNMALAACGILGLACGAMAQETVKLEYKLPAGTEMVYKSSGTFKMSMSGQGDMTATLGGTERFVIAEADPAGLLIGQLPDIQFAAKMTQSNGKVDNQNQSFNDGSVCRLDRAGNLVTRKLKGEEKLPEYTRMILYQIGHRDLDISNLPVGAVAVGATWESSADASIPAIPVPSPSKVVSTLAEIRTVDGHKCALIKSKLTPTGQKLLRDSPEITGDVETIFDIDGGFSRSVASKLSLKVSRQNVSGTVETSVVFDSMKTLPPEEAAREAAVIKALDAAVTRLYEGEYDKATDALEALKPAEIPEAWKAGINKSLGQVKRFVQMAKGGRPVAVEAAPADPAQKLFAEAEKARADQKWADAVAKYKEVAEKYPAYPMTPVALARAAEVCETKLNDKPAADALRQQALAQQEKRAAGGSPIELYKLAVSYAESGDAEKAVATYRKVLAGDSPEIPPQTRLVAQWRIGGLLEKQGKTAEAVEAYKAMAEMKGDDSYSTKLKEQAKKKLEALSAATPK